MQATYGMPQTFAARGYFVVTFDNRGVGTTHVPGKAQFDPDPGAPTLAGAGSDTGTDQAVESSAVAQAAKALFTLDDMADDVAVLLRHFGTARAHICGNSMGGQITLLVGIRHPELCLSLTVLMAASPISDAVKLTRKLYPEYWARRASRPPPPGSGLSSLLKLADISSDAATSPEGGVTTFASPETRAARRARIEIDFWRGGIDYARPGSALKVGEVLQSLAIAKWATSAECANMDRLLAGLVAAPTIFIGGRNDPIIPIESQRDTCGKVGYSNDHGTCQTPSKLPSGVWKQSRADGFFWWCPVADGSVIVPLPRSLFRENQISFYKRF